MKQEQLQLLAEWYYDKIEMMKNVVADCIRILIIPANTEEKIYDLFFRPHKDSNQLDMLKKKFIEELRKYYAYSLIRIEILVGRNGCYDLKIFVDRNLEWLLLYEEASSNNENEFWLDAMLNYVEGLK